MISPQSDDVMDVLVDCLSSFVAHGDDARAAAAFLLSDASGLSVSVADLARVALPEEPQPTEKRTE